MAKYMRPTTSRYRTLCMLVFVRARVRVCMYKVLGGYTLYKNFCSLPLSHKNPITFFVSGSRGSLHVRKLQAPT